MGIGPWRPVADMRRHLERGDIDMAIAVAGDFVREYRRGLPPAVAVWFLPAIARHRPEEYDRWASRWMRLWLQKNRHTESIAQAADLLVRLPHEPDAFSLLRRLAAS